MALLIDSSALCCRVQPVEFCSDVFLLPLGSPSPDILDFGSDPEGGYPKTLPPLPPPRAVPNMYESVAKTYCEILQEKLEFNNNNYVSSILNK